jgi:hypothetical protein
VRKITRGMWALDLLNDTILMALLPSLGVLLGSVILLGLSSPAAAVNSSELQFQLIDEPLAALGARTELLALHLRDYQLQMRDQRLRTRELGARLDLYLQCRHIRPRSLGSGATTTSANPAAAVRSSFRKR